MRARKEMGGGRLLARTFVLDCEGLSQAATGDHRVEDLLKEARRREAGIVVSAATLTEALRGKPRDAAVHRVLSSVHVEPLTPALGRQAGVLLGTSGLQNSCAVDAMVAATALVQQRPVVILTSDVKDLSALVEGEEAVGVLHV